MGRQRLPAKNLMERKQIAKCNKLNVRYARLKKLIARLKKLIARLTLLKNRLTPLIYSAPITYSVHYVQYRSL